MSQTTIGREYLRVSRDRSGQLRSPAEQHDDNRRAADANSWVLGDPYQEDGAVSASRYSQKARVAFDKLVTDLEAGRFGAGVLILWESSRGSRRVGEWVRLIEACEDANVRIHVTTHGRTYDPANARDRRSMLEDAVDSEYESGKTSARIRRANAAAAADGKPHGRVPFGYRRVYDPVTRRLAGQEPEPAEAAIVAELFARLQEGHSLKGIAADFAERGIRNHSGGPFSPQHLRDIAMRPAYAGLRLHRPGEGNKHRGGLDGAVKGQWPPLVDPATFYAVRAMLQAPERRTTRGGRARHLLSLIAACDECGGLLTATYRSGDREYRCRDKACVRIRAGMLDALAEEAMLAYLAQPAVMSKLRGPDGDKDGEVARARGELAAARAELAALRRAGREGRLSVATMLEVEPGLAGRVDELETRERELSTPPALAGLIAPGEDAALRWQRAPVEARRQVARLLCSPDVLGQMRLRRSPIQNHSVPAKERVVWRRTGDE
jgi:site-specific DNA recombinase